MDREERIELTAQMLVSLGWSEKNAKATAVQSTDDGSPVLETYSLNLFLFRFTILRGSLNATRKTMVMS